MAPNEGERSTSNACQAPTLVELAPAAQFIESDRGERSEQREAGCEREQQRHHRIAEHHRAMTRPSTG